MFQIPIICSTLDEIYIKLKGLYIGEYRTGDGVVSIGSLDLGEDRLTQISEALTKSTSFVQTTKPI